MSRGAHKPSVGQDFFLSFPSENKGEYANLTHMGDSFWGAFRAYGM
jgi:hypothetical protein